MSYFSAKPFGIAFAENLDFMSRAGIYWKWGGTGFSGHSFGSSHGPVHCFMRSGLHEFAHCIDFIMHGKADRITRHGLQFRMFWEKWIEVLGVFDGDPKSPEMTHCEGRVFALQAYLMNRELGFIVDDLPSGEENDLRKAGQLTEFPIITDEWGAREWGRNDSLLKRMSVEEYAHEKASLEPFKWKDDDVFLSQYGYGYSSGLSYGERKERWRECFPRFILQEYERLNNPFVERRISRAISELGERMRRFHRSAGYVPGEQVLGVRHSGIERQRKSTEPLISER